MKPTVFIGSSSEQKSVARALEVNLEADAEVNLWPHSFSPGQSIYHQLMELSGSFDFAIIIITSDDAVISREVVSPAPRDNVIFELGLFLGSIGPERVFAVTEAGSHARMMSDYQGVNYLTYDGKRSDGDFIKALSPASTQIISRIKKIGRRTKKTDFHSHNFDGRSIGLENIFENFETARPYIYEDLKNTNGPIRVFVQIASQDFGLKGSFFDVLDEVVQKQTVDIRVLHAAHESPLFEKNRLISLGKDYDRVIKSLDYASLSLKTLEESESSALRRRSHHLPFIWRLYFVFERLYMMPYFAEKDATNKSPVLVFSRTENSLYHVFKDWFDHVWTVSSPERVEMADVVSPAAPAGAALFLKWGGKHVFGIPMRDLRSNPDRVRFYGVGGKRQSGSESFEACAFREGSEELSGAVERLESAEKTMYVRNDGSTRDISITDAKILPRLILEKANHSGLGAMPANADDYILVAFDGVLKLAPTPSRELAAVVILSDDCLELFLKLPIVTIADLRSGGGEIILQDGVEISDEAVLVPHGTAAYSIRNLI